MVNAVLTKLIAFLYKKFGKSIYLSRYNEPGGLYHYYIADAGKVITYTILRTSDNF